MYKLLNNIKISSRAALSVMLFIATLIYSTYGAYSSIGANIAFAEKEKIGNYYQRPLAQILYDTNLLQIELSKNDTKNSQVDTIVGNISQAMEELKKVQDEVGAELQFTDEGLSSRGREHLSYDSVSAKWQSLKDSKKPEDLVSFIADIRGMIAHSGDTSNLVLDPYLDSYYLMDVTLLALPQTINRIGDISAYVQPLISNSLMIGLNEKIKFKTSDSLLNESDIGRILADFDISFTEDPNFYGVSTTYEQKVRPLLSSYEEANKNLGAVLEKMSTGRNPSAENLYKTLQDSLYTANALWVESLDQLDILLQARIESYKAQQWVGLGWSALGIIISMIFYVIVVQSIVSPLSDLTRMMTNVAKGDLSDEVPYKESRSEIGSIAQALDVFKNNRLETIKLEEEQKALEERAVREKRTMLDNLAHGFEQGVQGMITSIASASTQLTQTAENMEKVAGETNQQSVEVASASEQASHNVQSVASAAEEMAATVGEISKQISLSNNIVNDAREKAEIADNSSKELVEMSKSVGAIATLIEDIAGQINLLALNATIESARSGEAGKGFAVVANEVKNLATQTAKATEQIRQQLEAVQNTAAGVAGSLGEVREAIAKVSEGSAAIAAAVEEQSAATQEIVSNMNTATQGVEQINGGIFAIKGGTDSTTTATRQVLEAARTLSGQATQMDKEVKNFLQNLLAA